MQSLTARLQIGIATAQVAAIIIAMVIFPLLAPFVTYEDIADMTARRLIKGNLIRNTNGTLTIKRNPDLRVYARSRPQFAFAVVDPRSLDAAVGSDPVLADFVKKIAPLFPVTDGNLKTDRPNQPRDKILITTEQTDFGMLVLATAGNQFGFSDIWSFFWAFLPAIFPTYGPVLLAVFVVTPWFVRKSFAPLRRVAVSASEIDEASVDRRLPCEGVPPEFLPLINSVNEALDRLDRGLARQRLYAANAAHELRTPVAILRARIDALPMGEQKLELKRDGQRIESLLEQLLTAARLGQQQLDMNETIDLVKLSKSVVSDRAPLALRGGLHLDLEAASPSVIVQGNKKSIESALSNLVDNALRAEPKGGTVIVSISPAGIIDVVDHGSGIAPDDRSLIFEPFWRGSDKSRGSGLGLAIVREVARRHRGTIEALETPGGGATLRFDLSKATVEFNRLASNARQTAVI